MGAQDRFRTRACPKCGWRGTENSNEKAAGFWQYGGLCAERQSRAAEKTKKIGLNVIRAKNGGYYQVRASRLTAHRFNVQTLIGVVRMQETTRRPRKNSRLKRPEKLRQK